MTFVSALRDGQNVALVLRTGERVVLEPHEADLLMEQISRVRHSQRHEVYGQVFALKLHKDGEIVTRGYVAEVIRKGDSAVLKRTRAFESASDALSAAVSAYGREVLFPHPTKDDPVSFAAAEREQVMFMFRQLAAARGISLATLMSEVRESKSSDSEESDDVEED